MITTFALYGTGWRADFYLRIARALPDRFSVCGIITRSPEKAGQYQRDYGIPCYDSIDALLAAVRPDFVVVSVNKSVCADVALTLARHGLPVLMETPAAHDLPTLNQLLSDLPADARIQVAEQYPLQPMHAARLSFLKTGKLGAIGHVNLSYTQGYHAIALIRKYLGIGFENAEITATTFPVSVTAGPGRNGDPQTDQIVQKMQTVAVLNFGEKTAIFNFENDQHRSWIRSQTVQIKGDRGELYNARIRYLHDFQTPNETSFLRKNLGEDENLEGVDLKGILGDGQWHYRNPYPGSRLADDEIAVASCMDAMAAYLGGGAPFYPLAEAAQDLYLSLMIEKAAQEGVRITTQTQPWAK